MTIRDHRIWAALLALVSGASAADVVLRNATIYDGTGAAPFMADVRVHQDRIAAVGKHLPASAGDTVRDLRGLALAPGFIDMHSHHDRGLFDDLDAATVSRQGVTTVVVGQDGDSAFPLANFLDRLATHPAAINVASMVGQATLRRQVMGEDLYRPSTPAELAGMKTLLERELRAGAFGLSTGLEYEASHFSTTAEVVELAKVAAKSNGFYISHVRDEASETFSAWDEVVTIGRDAGIPVEITHIKIGATQLWHQAAARLPGYFATAKREDVNLKADIYPYTYWFSTIRVIVQDRDYFNPAKVEKALAENGGPGAIRITRYVPDPSLAGKTLAEFATIWQLSAVEAYMRVIRETAAEVNSDEEMESVIVTSMSEDDVNWLVAQPQIMFCSDGELHGAHPRGAGAFPRILGHYVRELRALPLALAIHKMTGLPAAQLGLKDRARIARGYVADLVVFDPATVLDQATVEHPEAPPLGVPAVMVAGEWVIDDGKVTGRRPGEALRSAAYRP
jgi:N-acyl-D-amino-acid deacylase